VLREEPLQLTPGAARVLLRFSAGYESAYRGTAFGEANGSLTEVRAAAALRLIAEECWANMSAIATLADRNPALRQNPRRACASAC
jgi:hypothetical protein